MIKPDQYKKLIVDGNVYFSYVTYDQVRDSHTPKELERFARFMAGQTCPVTGEESAMKENWAIYAWDYERWLEGGMKDRQGRNWD